MGGAARIAGELRVGKARALVLVGKAGETAEDRSEKPKTQNETPANPNIREVMGKRRRHPLLLL